MRTQHHDVIMSCGRKDRVCVKGGGGGGGGYWTQN